MKLIELCTRRPVAVSMLTVAVLLFGLVSVTRLPVTLLPELSYPTLTVRTELPGAAPTEVETLLSKPIEEALGIIKNVRQVRSVSQAGRSDVTLEFNWGTAMDYAVLDVREKLDALTLPKEAVRPIVLRFDPSTDPVVRVGLAFKHADGRAPARADESALKRLRRIAEDQVQKPLESVPGVAAVKISGGLEDQIQVQVDLQKLAQLKLTLQDIVDRLSAENANISGGRVEEGSASYLVRTLNQFKSLDEIRNTILAARAERPVYLRDVAAVTSGYKQREAIIRIGREEAVEIALYKEGDANTVRVAGAIKQRLDALRETLPGDLELKPLYDQSVFIRQATNEVLHAALLGGLLAVLVIYLFLRNAWVTAIVSVSIPVSVIAAFNLMYGAGLSLNIMSLGGIALAIGLIVDDAIVVLENITRKHEAGLPMQKAAVAGAGEVAGAVVASTLTNVAVFFPMVFVQGIAGQLFGDQALVVTGALMFSLIVSLTLTPMLVSRQARAPLDVPSPPREEGRHLDIPSPPREEGRHLDIPSPLRGEGQGEGAYGERTALQGGNARPGHPSPPPSPRSAGRGRKLLSRVRWVLLEATPVWSLRLVLGAFAAIARLFGLALRPTAAAWQRGYKALEGRYVGWLSWSLKHPAWILGVALAGFVGALALLPRIGVELIPPFNQGEFKAELTLPPGTPLARTDDVVREAAGAMRDNPDLSAVYSVAGQGNRLDTSAATSGENQGTVNLALKPGASRHEPDVMAALSRRLDGIPGLSYRYTHPTLFTLRTPLEVEVHGYDLDAIAAVSEQLRRAMLASKRFTQIETTRTPGQPEIQVRFDQERAAALGLDTAELANRVARAVQGDVATRYRRAEREIEVLVRGTEADRASVDAVENLAVNPEAAQPVRLSSVADVSVRSGPSEIRRADGSRVAIVSAGLAYGDLGEAVAELKNLIGGLAVPPGVQVSIAGQSEEMQVSFRSLQFALALAVFLVYLVMASQFESLIHPFVILFTIPLAAIGAILALYVTGSVINVVALIGMIMLAGIVVKNGIVLIDLVNRLRAEGRSRLEAIVEGGRARLRPILMTSLTAVLGLLPMALGGAEGSEVRQPMAITVIGGLLVSTALTLVVIPVVYLLLDREAPAAVGEMEAGFQK